MYGGKQSMGINCASLLGLLSLLMEQEPAAAPPPPAVLILLKDRNGQAAVSRHGTTHVGGGNIEVVQPAPDTLVISMSGVAVATDHPFGSHAAIRFALEQNFEVAFAKRGLQKAKLMIEGRVIGLLRSSPKGRTAEHEGCVTLSGGGPPLTSVCLPPRAAAGGENLSINDRVVSERISVAAGHYSLNQTWEVEAAHSKCILGKAASAEFAPDPALDPQWISRKSSFHGSVKKTFGFQVTITARPDTDGTPETLPEPKKVDDAKR
jgi:hypothetical protein